MMLPFGSHTVMTFHSFFLLRTTEVSWSPTLKRLGRCSLEERLPNDVETKDSIKISRRSKLPSRTPQRQPTWEQIFQMVNSFFYNQEESFSFRLELATWSSFFIRSKKCSSLTAHLALPIETVDPEKHQDEEMVCWPCRLLFKKISVLLHIDEEKDENKERGRFCY